MRFVSFLSGGFITDIVVNPPEKKLAKRTSVQCDMICLVVLYFRYCPIGLTKDKDNCQNPVLLGS